MYDHNDGQAVTGGFAYHGRIAALRGKFVFGDIVAGRLFVADLAAMKKADDGIPQTVAPVEESPAVRARRRRQPHLRDVPGADRGDQRRDRRRGRTCTSAAAATGSSSSRRGRTA